MDNMTKTIINEILDHGDDDYANRIREKEESLSNTKKHCLNIPLAKTDNDLNDMIYGEDNDFVDSYVVTAEYDNAIEKNVNKEEPELESYDDNNMYDTQQPIMDFENEVNVNAEVKTPEVELPKSNMQKEIESISDEKRKIINIVNRDFNLIIGNYAKPINVKDHMLANFKRKANPKIASEIKNPTSVHVDESLEDTYEIPVLNISKKNLYINDKQFADNFNQIYNELNMERQKSLNIIKEFDDITTAVTESDKVIQALDNKYNEAEEQLKAVEMRSYEIEQRILEVLNNERDRIAGVAKEKENLISSASKRMEENNEKIIDYQEKIASTIQKTKEANIRIAQQEELLRSLGNNILDFNSYTSEEQSKKAI